MNKPNLLVSIFLLIIMVVLIGCKNSNNDTKNKKYNVLLFVSDDHGIDLGAYGNSVIKTPNFDSFAKEGIRFTNAYATSASCSASRSVLLTGLQNHDNAQFGHTHDYHHFTSYGDIRSLPVLLSENGYRTASAGKYHVAPESVYHFQNYIKGDHRNPVEMAENCKPFIDADNSKPFFLYFATADPHRGGGLMAGGTDDNTASTKGGTNRFGNKDEGYKGIMEIEYNPAEIIVPSWLPDNLSTRLELAQYYQSISRLDQGFGRMINILKEKGEFDNTLIIYLSDHGPAFAGAKTTVYDPGLQAPLLVRYPGGNKGEVSDAMISWVDITPTILDFAGVEFPTYKQHIKAPEILGLFPELTKTHGLHGKSFVPFLRGENPAGWDTIYASHTFHEIQMYYPMRVIRDRKYKLILNIASGLTFPFSTDLWASTTWQTIYQQGMDAKYGPRTVEEYIHRPKYEFYDVENDPLESTNLAGNPKYTKLFNKYKQKLKDYQIRSSDPWVSKYVYE